MFIKFYRSTSVECLAFNIVKGEKMLLFSINNKSLCFLSIFLHFYSYLVMFTLNLQFAIVKRTKSKRSLL